MADRHRPSKTLVKGGLRPRSRGYGDSMMTTRALAAVLLVGILLVDARAEPEETGLSAEGEAFLAELQTAGWSGHVSAGGVDVTVRQAPLYSAGMLSAVRNRASLSEAQRSAIDDVARVVLAEPGWFFDNPVPAGSYHLGLGFRGKTPALDLFDAVGKRLGTNPFWIMGPSSQVPTASVSAADGAAKVAISTGGITIDVRFVPRARHDELAKGLATTSHGSVRIHSDLDAPERLARLAGVAASTLSAQAGILGCDVAEGPYEVFLLQSADTFNALDRILTGGKFEKTWAFTSHVTGKSYLRYGPRADSDALTDAGFPLKSRSLVLHELGHQLARRAFPHRVAPWPDWLSEGLAELGAERALMAANAADGAAFYRLMVGNWLRADRRGTVPPLADLVGGYMDSGRTGYYTTCYLLAREMARKPKRLHELLEAVGEEAATPAAAIRARDECARLYGRMDVLLDRARVSIRTPAEPPPAVPLGYLDVVDDHWRIVSVPDNAARVVLPGPVKSTEGVTVEVTFSYHPSGQQQTDVYVGIREGRHTRSFLKVALMPKRIMLFWFRHGTWHTCGTVDYKTPLAVGTTSKRAWHDLKIRYRVADRKVRVDTTGGRWAELDVPGHVPVAGTHVGIGVYSGVAYFKEPVVHQDSSLRENRR